MKTQVLDIHKLKKFGNEKPHKETIWSDDNGRINLLCMKPGQEIVTHTHHGNHIWMVMEGRGEIISPRRSQTAQSGPLIRKRPGKPRP